MTQRRLVIYRTDNGPEAALYPLDANAFSRPEWVFPLSSEQPLPDQEPGSVVTVEGELKSGAVPTVMAGDIEIVPARGLQNSSLNGDRIFAERGEVIAHPQAIGWDTSWRHVASPSSSSLRQWESRMRKAFWGAVFAWALVLCWVAFAAWRAVNGESTRGPGIVTALSVSAATVSGVYAVRARRTVRRARRLADAPTQPMTMRVWWAAGGPEGPMAMAALFPPDADDSAPAVSHVPLVDAPPRLVTPDRVPVDVRGDPTDAPVIVHDGDELWPAHSTLKGQASPKG